MKNILLTLLAVVLSVSSLTAQSITTSGGVRLEEFDCTSYGILWYNRWHEPIVKIAEYSSMVARYSSVHDLCKYTVEGSKSYFLIDKHQGKGFCSFRVSYYNEYGQWEWTEVFIDGNYEGCVSGGRNYN